MKRPGCAGDFWPTPAQEALLAVALRPDGADVWRGIRSTLDVDRLPGELHRLLPLVARTLADAEVEDPDLPRLRGVRQYTWYRNQRLFADAGTAVSALQGRGLSPRLLRGAATTLLTHGDLGLRPMNDLDLLVDGDELEGADRNLRADGWRPVPQPEVRRGHEGAAAYLQAEGRRLVVHWQPTRNLAEAPTWWSTGPAVELGGASLPTLDPSSHLLQTIVDGARALSGSGLRWIMDAVGLLRAGPPADPGIAELAGRLHVAPLLADALGYLRSTFDAPVPEGTLEELDRRAAEASRRDRLAHRLSGAEVPRLGRLPELAGRYVRLTADRPAGATVAGVPRFLQAVLGVEQPTGVPVALARKAASVLAGRGPEAARGPESSRP